MYLLDSDFQIRVLNLVPDKGRSIKSFDNDIRIFKNNSRQPSVPGRIMPRGRREALTKFVSFSENLP